MILLLDAHTLIWAVDDPAKLGAQATPALQDPANELLLGAGTIWELAIVDPVFFSDPMTAAMKALGMK